MSPAKISTSLAASGGDAGTAPVVVEYTEGVFNGEDLRPDVCDLLLGFADIPPSGGKIARPGDTLAPRTCRVGDVVRRPSLSKGVVCRKAKGLSLLCDFGPLEFAGAG